MKCKILILFFLIFTGCTTIEIEEYAIIAGIGFDYQNNEYIVTYEIYDDESGDVTALTSTVVTGIGLGVEEAIVNTELLIEQKTYLNHCRIIIFSNNIVNDQMKEVINYLVHDPRMRSLEYVVISDSQSPQDLFNRKDKENVLCLNLYKDIKKNNNSFGIYSDCKFSKIVNLTQNNRKTTVIPSIKYDKTIIFDGAVLFDRFTIKQKISQEEVMLIQMLDNKLVEGLYNYNSISYYIKRFKSKKKYSNNKMTIELFFSLTIYDGNNQEKLINDFNASMKEQVANLLQKYQILKIDPFGVLDYIFNYHPFIFNKQSDIWEFYKQLNIEVIINTQIIATGFIEKVME